MGRPAQHAQLPRDCESSAVSPSRQTRKNLCRRFALMIADSSHLENLEGIKLPSDSSYITSSQFLLGRTSHAAFFLASAQCRSVLSVLISGELSADSAGGCPPGENSGALPIHPKNPPRDERAREPLP